MTPWNIGIISQRHRGFDSLTQFNEHVFFFRSCINFSQVLERHFMAQKSFSGLHVAGYPGLDMNNGM